MARLDQGEILQGARQRVVDAQAHGCGWNAGSSPKPAATMQRSI
jgi:hypothetical protein